MKEFFENSNQLSENDTFERLEKALINNDNDAIKRILSDLKRLCIDDLLNNFAIYDHHDKKEVFRIDFKELREKYGEIKPEKLYDKKKLFYDLF